MNYRLESKLQMIERYLLKRIYENEVYLIYSLITYLVDWKLYYSWFSLSKVFSAAQKSTYDSLLAHTESISNQLVYSVVNFYAAHDSI